AGLGDGEDALALGLDPASLAHGTDARCGPGLGAGAVARGAGRGCRHGQGNLGAVHSLVEGECHLGLEIAAALHPGAAADTPGPRTTTTGGAPGGSAEQVREDVAEAAAERARVKPAGEASERTRA